MKLSGDISAAANLVEPNESPNKTRIEKLKINVMKIRILKN